MNKNAIKNYAVWARKELITRVTQKAFEYGVSKDNIIDASATSINGKLLTSDEQKQRQQLINNINHKGFEQVIEEVAYTWFNRFIALRYMEVNNYLPNRIRIFTNDSNEFKPQIIDEAMNIELEGLAKELVFDLLEKNKKEELYKQLIIATCNDMGNYLPGIFTKISDYKVLLFPDNILKEENIVGRLITNIDEDSWLEQVQIIGWLYQFYVSEKHENVVNPLYGKEVKKEDIPAATQLFTTDWIVQYMVDNSLGKYWIERNPKSNIVDDISHYVKQNSGDEKFENINISDLTIFDPCMGSGHILVYAFDLLMKIYKELGYSEREASIFILENNLYGLDIDERAYQLSYFALMMKARKYNRRIFNSNVKLNISYVEESNDLYLMDDLDIKEEYKSYLVNLINTYKDAKEIGSLSYVESIDYDELGEYLDMVVKNSELNLETLQWETEIVPKIKLLCKQASIMSKKYVAVVTNPPYLGKYDAIMKKFITDNYKDYSTDLFAAFIKRNMDYTLPKGYLGFMTPNVWMFIKSYEKLRNYIIKNVNINSFIQLAKGAFYDEATVDICTFVLKKSRENVGVYFRLDAFKGKMKEQESAFLQVNGSVNDSNKYIVNQKQFASLPGSPIAFWIDDNSFNNYRTFPSVGSCSYVKKGMFTGENERFFRLWHEVTFDKIAFGLHSKEEVGTKLYVPVNSGGPFRRWYGNRNTVIKFDKLHYDIITKNKGHRNPQFYFNKSAPWTKITSGMFSMRLSEEGFINNDASMAVYEKDVPIEVIMALMNSKIAQYYLNLMNESLNYTSGNVASVPLAIPKEEYPKYINITKKCVELVKKDWDSNEQSWDFNKHPILNYTTGTLEEACNLYIDEVKKSFCELKKLEYELNSELIKLYNLSSVIHLDLEDKEISIRIPTKENLVKSLISYFVGVLFGRYTIDVNMSTYQNQIYSKTNIVPIYDDEYSREDIVYQFTQFISNVFGDANLEKNMNFIGNILGGNGGNKDKIYSYFINSFYADHCKSYQKRPIYWLFDSGKKNGFKALIYIHRYTPDLVARMRTQYIHEQQARYRTQIEMLERQIDGDVSTSERVRLNKQLKKFKEQDEELRKYEEKIHHWADRMEPMDLDDGVKVNYAKFQELLAKIK